MSRIKDIVKDRLGTSQSFENKAYKTVDFEKLRKELTQKDYNWLYDTVAPVREEKDIASLLPEAAILWPETKQTMPKIYYPFATFQSSSKPGTVYAVNLRLLDDTTVEISCTCGSWKFYRNRPENNGGCIHTVACTAIYGFGCSIAYSETNGYTYTLSIRSNGSGSVESITYSFTNKQLDALSIPLIIAIDGEKDLRKSFRQVVAAKNIKNIKDLVAETKRALTWNDIPIISTENIVVEEKSSDIPAYKRRKLGI